MNKRWAANIIIGANLGYFWAKIIIITWYRYNVGSCGISRFPTFYILLLYEVCHIVLYRMWDILPCDWRGSDEEITSSVLYKIT